MQDFRHEILETGVACQIITRYNQNLTVYKFSEGIDKILRIHKSPQFIEESLRLCGRARRPLTKEVMKRELGEVVLNIYRKHKGTVYVGMFKSLDQAKLMADNDKLVRYEKCKFKKDSLLVLGEIDGYYLIIGQLMNVPNLSESLIGERRKLDINDVISVGLNGDTATMTHSTMYEEEIKSLSNSRSLNEIRSRYAHILLDKE